MFNSYLEVALNQFQNKLSKRFSPLVEAMQYSLDGGGKRLRPMLVLSSAEYLGIDIETVLPAATAIEFVHTYSLIHDDLPALDNDDFRRGKPSSHKKFGEAIAILAGDALLTESFGQILSLGHTNKFKSEEVLNAVELLVQCSGVRGMVGGQLLDITTEHPNYTLPEVEFIHIHKTGALILASVLLPAKLAGVSEEQRLKLRRFGESVGLAFQISDDLLDSESILRYSRGPRSKPKPSYCQLMSPSEIKSKLDGLIDSAVASVSDQGKKAEGLIQIAEFIRTRKH
jgi:geranylgeranyl diphosphate synthase type II